MKRAFALLGILIFSACSGGGSAVPGAKSASPGTGTHAGTALAIKIPNARTGAGAARRSPAFIPSATQSVAISVNLTDTDYTPLAGYPIDVNLTPSSPGCVPGQSSTVCTISLSLAPGNYLISLTLYDGLNATGNALSTASNVPATIVQGVANQIGVTLGGIPASIHLAASSGTAVAQEHVVTLPSNSSGTLTAYALDLDGDEIIGPGAPTITATTDNGAQIAVTQPTAGTPNAVGLASLATNAIAHVTLTATPVAAPGTGPVSRWVTVQDPAMSLVYIISATAFNIFDQTATEVTPSTASISSIQPLSGAVGATYDSANQLIYVSVQGSGNSYIVAFDKSGTPVPLNAGATGLGTIGQIAYDPLSGYIYVTSTSTAIDGSGNAHSLYGGINFSYGATYDAYDDLIVVGSAKYNAAGQNVGSFPFPSAGGIQAETFNGYNGLFYVATAYPTAVEVWTTTGVHQSTSGSFAVPSAAFIGAIGSDPGTGNVYVATNTRMTYGFDSQGNALPAPWHTLANFGAGSDAGNVLLIRP
jgi:hypothetical protein